MRSSLQPIWAIARLTWRAAFRFKLVRVLGLVLIGGVFLLPAVIKDDGTARGFTQIVLTYTLGLITSVLGLATLWLACGTLARDIDECHIQMVAVKPIPRWQIWAGRWLGLLVLDAFLLSLSSGIVFAQMVWRSRQLPEAQQQVLRNEIFVARGSAKPEVPDIEPEVEARLKERLKNETVAAMDRNQVRKIIREQIKAQRQVVQSGWQRTWPIDLSGVKESLRDRPLYLRMKFFVAEKSPSGTYVGMWDVGAPQSPVHWREMRSQAAETFYEIPITTPNLIDPKGILYVTFINQNPTALLFPLDEGMEVLYREGGFGLNYFRGMAIVFCWLALIAAVGLFAASFLSFPVAAFLSLGVLVLAFSTGTMSQVIEEGTIREVNHDTGRVDKETLFDTVTVGLFKGLLGTINLVRDFSPIDNLSSGRSITWGQLTRAFAQIVMLVGGIFAGIGMVVLTRRELATAQAKS